MRAHTQWRWHLDEVFVTKKRDRKAAVRFLRKTMKRYGRPEVIVTDRLRSYRVAMKVIGRWLNNRAENSHQPLPTTRASDGEIQEYKVTTEIRLDPRLDP